MADVRLDFYDLDDDILPDMCMQCGAASTVRPIKTFAWMPYWARFMPYGTGYAFMKRRRVPVPLCERHKNHWMIRYLLGFGGLAVFLLLFICGGVMFGSNVDADPHGPLTLLGGAMLVMGGIAFLAWLVVMIVLGVTQILPVEITDDTITLKNVSPEFVRAYREMTRHDIDPDVERAAREQFRRPPREDDDPRRRRRDDDYPPDDKYRRR
jgi:hypothetical protein